MGILSLEFRTGNKGKIKRKKDKIAGGTECDGDNEVSVNEGIGVDHGFVRDLNGEAFRLILPLKLILIK